MELKNRNEDNSLVSIIVPVYNAEKYLYICIQSILQQSYSDFEIIIVDDGSTDSSRVICDGFAKRDKRIRVIHKNNEGVSEARNDALKIAKGKYVAFIDADDFITQNYICELMLAITRADADIAIGGYEKLGGISLSRKKKESNFANQIIILNRQEPLSKNNIVYHTICTNIVGCCVWNKLFKKELLKNMKFDKNLSIGEDMVFALEYELKCNSFAYVYEDIYKYRMNPSSALNFIDNKSKSKNIYKWISALDAARKVKLLTEMENTYLRECADYRMVRSSLWVMYHMIIDKCFDKQIAREIKNLVKESYRGYKRIGFGTMKQQIAVWIMKMSPYFLFVMGTLFLNFFPNQLYKISRQ